MGLAGGWTEVGRGHGRDRTWAEGREKGDWEEVGGGNQSREKMLGKVFLEK